MSLLFDTIPICTHIIGKNIKLKQIMFLTNNRKMQILCFECVRHHYFLKVIIKSTN